MPTAYRVCMACKEQRLLATENPNAIYYCYKCGNKLVAFERREVTYRRRDSQRERLYRAENKAAFRGVTFKTAEQVQAYADALTGSAWFLRRYGAKKIIVGEGRGRRSAVAVGTRRIEIPASLRYEAVILHEIAHTITTGDKHGPIFARAFLELVEHKLGKASANELRAAMREEGVRYSKPRNVSPERRAQLREQGKRLAELRRQRLEERKAE